MNKYKISNTLSKLKFKYGPIDISSEVFTRWYNKQESLLGGSIYVKVIDRSKPITINNLKASKNLKYLGSFSERMEDQIHKKVRSCFVNQITRTTNKKSPSYIFYGKKNIRVKYSLEQLENWFRYELNNISNYDLKSLSIGRIDHSKGYSLDNIKLETISDNSKERIKRLPRPNTFLYAVSESETIVFRSCGAAARFFGIKRPSILRNSLKCKSIRMRIDYKLYNREQFYSL
jgi:hypothetical protein